MEGHRRTPEAEHHVLQHGELFTNRERDGPSASQRPIKNDLKNNRLL